MMNEDKKHFDVAHPGTTTSDRSSRPTIVGSTEAFSDPMMKKAPSTQPSLATHKEAVLQQPTLKAETPAVSNDIPKDMTSVASQGAKSEAEKLQHNEKTQELINAKTYQVEIGAHKGKSSAIIAIIVVVSATIIVGIVAYLYLNDTI